MKPLAIDLFCGLGGWTDGLLAEGWSVLGVDIEAHQYGPHRYPATLLVHDVLDLHGAWFKDADLIVASPPCQEYSYMAMPWSRAKAKAAAIRADTTGAEHARLNRLFEACFRIQREASEAAGRHIPMVVENVRGAQPWVGKAVGKFGSFYLWGDVPELPVAAKAVKVGGIDFNGYGTPGYKPVAFNDTAIRKLKDAGIKSGGDWFNAEQPSISRTTSSKSRARKAASAMIAKIPEPLARHIARHFYPKEKPP